MDHRDNSIVEQVLKSNKISLRDLSIVLHTTSRNTQHLVYELNEDLQAQKLPILLIDSNDNVYFSKVYEGLDKELRDFLLQNNFYTYRLTKNERRTIIAMILLNSTDYVTTNDLAEHLQTSRGTIISDINQVKDNLKDKGIKLVSQVSRGYFVQGREETIRSQILKILLMNFNQNMTDIQYNTFQHFLLREIIPYEDIYPQLKKIILEEEKSENLLLSDFSFEETIYELLIIISRLKKGRIIEETDKNLTKSSKYGLSSHILQRVCVEFQIMIPSSEINHFVQSLRTKSYIHSTTDHIDEIAIPVMIGEVIFCIANYLRLNFYLDSSLYDLLVDHIKSALYRAKSGDVSPVEVLDCFVSQTSIDVIGINIIIIQSYSSKVLDIVNHIQAVTTWIPTTSVCREYECFEFFVRTKCILIQYLECCCIFNATKISQKCLLEKIQ